MAASPDRKSTMSASPERKSEIKEMAADLSETARPSRLSKRKSMKGDAESPEKRESFIEMALKPSFQSQGREGRDSRRKSGKQMLHSASSLANLEETKIKTKEDFQYLPNVRVWFNAELRKHQLRVKTGEGHPFPHIRLFVLSSYFEVGVNGLIMLNCVLIGWQADIRDPTESDEQVLDILDHFFAVSFFLDLMLKIIVFNWTMLFVSENWLDIFLVSLSSVSIVARHTNLQLEILRKFTVLRTIRIIRIGKAVKHRPEFREMWALVKGLTDSGETLFWTYVMIGCVLYFFAVMGTSLIGKQDFMAEVKFNSTLPQERIDELQTAQDIAERYFGNVAVSMFTLFQVMTLDSWTGIMRPLAQVEPWINAFFVFFISVASFVLMNLIVAVIVENAFENSNDEQAELARQKEQQKEQDIEDLKKLFEKIDEDGSGKISKEELINAAADPRVRVKLRTLDIMTKDIETVWEILDDGDGELEVWEFVEGIRRLQGEAKAKDILRLQKELRVLTESVEDIRHSMWTSTDGLNRVRDQIKRTSDDIEAFRRTMARAKEAVKLASRNQQLSAP